MNKTTLIDLTGQRFGKLTVISRGPDKVHPWGIKVRWICRCDCGRERLLRAGALRSGNTKTCGIKPCMHNPGSTTHGKKHSAEYKIWGNMKSRCFNSRATHFKYYGGRGITVCERWTGLNGFANFLEDMGPRPTGMEINRIDNDGDYTPQNCEWVTKKVNNNNRRPLENQWSQEHIALLGTMNDRKVAAIVGRTSHAVRTKRAKLGIANFA